MDQILTVDEPMASAGSAANTETAPNSRTIEVRTLECDEHSRWDEALDRSPHRSIFLKSCFLEPIGKAFDIRILRIGVFEQGRLAAGLAGRQIDTGHRPALDRIPLVPYAVWMCDDGPALPHRARRRGSRLLGHLSEHLQQAYRSVTFETPPGLVDIRPFLWSGWRSEARFTMITELTENDENRYDPDVRRRARIAESEDVRFVFDASTSEFEEIRQKTLDRQHAGDDLAPGALRRLLDGLMREHDVRIYGARMPDGRLGAANVVVYDSGTAYYWMAGMDPRLSRSGANQLCVAGMLRASARLASCLDWVGGNTPGVADFKESFAPTLTPHFRLQWKAMDAGTARVRPRRIWSWLRGHGGYRR